VGQHQPVTGQTGARRAWPASRLAALALAVLAVLILAGSPLLYALTHQNLAENDGQDVVIFASFVTVGLVIAWHRPGNPIGWIILAGRPGPRRAPHPGTRPPVPLDERPRLILAVSLIMARNGLIRSRTGHDHGPRPE
jgi:hypothetical protein